MAVRRSHLGQRAKKSPDRVFSKVDRQVEGCTPLSPRSLEVLGALSGLRSEL